jgi:hypothetical protein
MSDSNLLKKMATLSLMVVVGYAKEYQIQDFRETWFWLRPEQGFYPVDVNLALAQDVELGEQL